RALECEPLPAGFLGIAAGDAHIVHGTTVRDIKTHADSSRVAHAGIDGEVLDRVAVAGIRLLAVAITRAENIPPPRGILKFLRIVLKADDRLVTPLPDKPHRRLVFLSIKRV